MSRVLAPIHLPIPVISGNALVDKEFEWVKYLSGLDAIGNFIDPRMNGTRQYFNTAVDERPDPIGNPDLGVFGALDGDISKVTFPISRTISGAATLGQPATGYQVTPETAAIYGQFLNTSGWNQSTLTASGRTAAIFSYLGANQAGQGDLIGQQFVGYATGVKVGATGPLGYLANSAIAARGGNNTAGAAGVYLQVEEFVNGDGGFDVSSLHFNARSNRTNDTGALGAWWGSFNSQSEGTKRINSGFSLSGLHRIGYDATRGDTLAAFAMKASDRFYGNSSVSGGFLYTTDLGDAWWQYTAAGGGHWDFIISGGTAFYVGPTNSAIPNGGLFIKDGMVAPDAVAGLAVIYVDTADGDLKCRFGDGTIKTIVVDT